jgi:membrane protease YdiL (CAAX protease family)
MSFDLGMFPVAPFLIALLIPLIYSLKNRKERRSVIAIIIASILLVALYPLVTFLGNAIPLFGYSIGKVVLFVLIPVITVLYLEKWKLKDIFSNLGVRKRGLPRSVYYGLIAAVVTIAITVLVSTSSQFDTVFRTIMFFEAFTEEFFFRGFLFLYLVKKTSLRVGYATSIVGFVLMHPQHFTSLFLISTIAQAVLLTVVADKTKNIIGPWISHGANRLFPSLIRSLLGA